MKIIFTLVTVLMSLAAFAGPEEHISNQTCYHLVKQEKQFVPADVPAQICLEALTIDTAKENVYVDSYFQAGLFTNLKVTSLVRKNEDFFNFKTEALLKNESESVCGKDERIYLVLNGLLDNYGSADMSNLQVSVVV